MYQLLRACSLVSFLVATCAALRLVAYDPILIPRAPLKPGWSQRWSTTSRR